MTMALRSASTDIFEEWHTLQSILDMHSIFGGAQTSLLDKHMDFGGAQTEISEQRHSLYDPLHTCMNWGDDASTYSTHSSTHRYGCQLWTKLCFQEWTYIKQLSVHMHGLHMCTNWGFGAMTSIIRPFTHMHKLGWWRKCIQYTLFYAQIQMSAVNKIVFPRVDIH